MNHPQLDEKEIFSAAFSLESADARLDYLKSVCSSHPEIFQRVSRLLQLQAEPTSFLEVPAAGVVATLAMSAPIERAGMVIGRYKLRELLGEGGMGSVYVAEQEQPVRRKVALKIIKPGMDSRQVISRFESERQALALMDHPNIAKVLDAGTTDNGLPYFVMELVKGVPITEYCDNQRLDTRHRLQLFLQLCQAVQHAHQKGIIHRDIKPSNVLVSVHDVTPVVKVIDFGVAKAISQQLAENTVYTALSQLVGTPLYMSPEQAGQSSLDVDTRSDVYSLGVLLYELLTGNTPFDKATLQQAGFDEMRRIIREVDPPKPSNRISTLQAGSQSTIAENRQLEPRKLSRQLRGDLDWIVMKAMEKDRNRRYDSPSAFAADLQKFLNNEPVTAGPPSKVYRMRKFMWRNRQNVILASLFIVTFTTVGLLQGLSWMGVQSRIQESLTFTRASLDANRLEQAQLHIDQLRKLTSGLFERQFQPDVERLLAELHARRRDQDDFASFNKDYAPIVSQLTRDNHSEDRAISALEIYRVLEDSNWLKQLEKRHYSVEQLQLVRERVYMLLVSLAYFRVEQRWGRADVTPIDVQQTLDRAAEFHPKTRGFHLIQAQLYDRLNDLEQSEREKQLIEAQRPESSWDYYFEGLYSKTAGNIDNAMLSFRYALRKEADHYDSLIMLGDCLVESKPARLSEAVHVFSACTALRPEIPEPYIKRARCYLTLKDKESCKWDLDRAIEVSVWERDLVDGLLERKGFLDGLGNVHEAKADNARIIATLAAYFVKLRNYKGKNPYENSRETAYCKCLMGDAQMWDGNKEAALRWYTEAYDEIVQLAGESDIRAIDYLQAIANLRTHYEDWEDAIPLLESLVAKNARRLGTDNPHPNFYVNSLMLAQCYRWTGRDKEAVATVTDLQRSLLRYKIKDDGLTLHAAEQWALIHLNTNRRAHDDAMTGLRESHETSLKAYGPSHPTTLSLAFSLGLAYLSEEDGPSLKSLSMNVLSRSSDQLSNVDKASFQCLLSNGYRLVGRTQEALDLAMQSVASLEKEKGRDHRSTLRSVKALAYAYLDLGQSDMALPLIQEYVERLAGKLSNKKPLFISYTEVGRQLIAAKEFGTAEPLLRKCVEQMTQLTVEPWERQSATSMFGAALAGLKRFDEAEPLLLEGYAGLKELESMLPPTGTKRLKESAQYLQQFYHAIGKADRETHWSRVADELTLHNSLPLNDTGMQ